MFGELILLRHAKSAWPVGIRDIDRPLSGRGVRNAGHFGELLAADSVVPDVVICSPAVRTRETGQLVADHAGIDPLLAQVDPRLYGATWWDVLDVVRELAPNVGRALIIGHNPSMEDLAGQLAGAGSNSDAVRHLRAKFPTCGAAFLESDEQWNRWGGNCAALKRFWTPR